MADEGQAEQRPPEHPNLARVRRFAADNGIQLEIRRFPAGTRTAVDAARAIGCEVAEIVKSLVFVADGHPVLALVSGVDRVDPKRLAAAVGARQVRRANGDEARLATSVPIGGIPPFGHTSRLLVVTDERLLGFRVVWAAAGLPDAVFPIDPHDLTRITDSQVAGIAELTDGLAAG